MQVEHDLLDVELYVCVVDAGDVYMPVMSESVDGPLTSDGSLVADFQIDAN